MLPIIISVVVFVSYLAYILVRYGIQRSISASYHNLSQAEKWMFTLSTWGYVLPLSFVALNGNEFQNILFIFATFLLCIVGVMTDDKAPEQKQWHSIGAEGGILLAFIWILTTSVWYVAIPSMAGIWIMYKLKPKNHTWWIEVLAYFTIIAAIYLNMHH